MKTHRLKIGIFVSATVFIVLIFLGVAQAHRTKLVLVNVDNRIDVDKTVQQIEELFEARSVSVFRNPTSLFSSNKIDKIRLRKMIDQGEEERVVWRGIGHIWMTDTRESKLFMVRLMTGGEVRVTRLFTSMCPPASSFPTKNNKQNKPDMATPRKPSD
jgi:hypothetical protein